MNIRQILALNYDEMDNTGFSFMDTLFIPWGVVSTITLFFVAFIGA